LKMRDILNNAIIGNMVPYINIHNDINHNTYSGPLPYTEIISWYFAQNLLDKVYCQGVCIKLKNRYDGATIKSKLEQILKYHDIFNMYYDDNSGHLYCEDISRDNIQFHTFDWREYDAYETEKKLNRLQKQMSNMLNIR